MMWWTKLNSIAIPLVLNANSAYQGRGGGGKKKKKNVVDHFRLSRAESRNMLNTSVFTQWVF